MRILFETERHDREILFENPSYIVECRKLSEVQPAFEEMEKLLTRGFYLAGFISYEAGYAFEKIFRNNKIYDFPLVCFGAYDRPSKALTPSFSKCRPCVLRPSPIGRGDGGEGYFSALHKIKRYLSAGETYQVNFTFKLKFNYWGNPFALYQELKKRQPTPYSAFIGTDRFAIASLSPELFFRKRGGKITVRPMKGTIAPGKRNAALLANDGKNRSENIMIVDLLRNDLGRIAKTGSVRAKKLFEVEKYETLYQMTSTVEAEIPEKIDLYELFSNLFPSGSVTGAPKIRTMQIIRELEKEERKIYTGSIGFITPQRDMVFNVAIRTLLLSTVDGRRSTGEMGIGSGVVYDSNPQKEYEECLLKANFLLAD